MLSYHNLERAEEWLLKDTRQYSFTEKKERCKKKKSNFDNCNVKDILKKSRK